MNIREEIEEYINNSREVKPPFFRNEWDRLAQIRRNHEHSGKEMPDINSERSSFWHHIRECPACKADLIRIVADQPRDLQYIIYYCKECGFGIPYLSDSENIYEPLRQVYEKPK